MCTFYLVFSTINTRSNIDSGSCKHAWIFNQLYFEKLETFLSTYTGNIWRVNLNWIIFKYSPKVFTDVNALK